MKCMRERGREYRLEFGALKASDSVERLVRKKERADRECADRSELLIVLILFFFIIMAQ